MEHESDGDINWNRYSHQSFGAGSGGFRNKRTSEDHPNYGLIKLGQNYESWRFEETSVTQTPVRNHQLTQV